MDKTSLPNFFTFIQRNHPHLWELLMAQYDEAEAEDPMLCPFTLGCLLCDMLGPHSDDINPMTIIAELSDHFNQLNQAIEQQIANSK